jgi:hypothetical protein
MLGPSRVPVNHWQSWIVAHFEILSAHPPIGVILSAAVFQAERRISRLTGPARKPNCTTTEIQNPRKFKTLGNSKP